MDDVAQEWLGSVPQAFEVLVAAADLFPTNLAVHNHACRFGLPVHPRIDRNLESIWCRCTT